MNQPQSRFPSLCITPDTQAIQIVGYYSHLCGLIWPIVSKDKHHFIILASPVNRDVNGGPVGWNWLCRWFQTLNLSFTSGWRRFGKYSHFWKDRKIPICLKRKIMDTVILPAMTYCAETWTLTKHQEKLAVAQRRMERLLLNITKRDKIWNEIIRSKTGVKDVIERVRCIRTMGRTGSQNEQHQVGQDNIRMDTQRRKTSKTET